MLLSTNHLYKELGSFWKLFLEDADLIRELLASASTYVDFYYKYLDFLKNSLSWKDAPRNIRGPIIPYIFREPYRGSSLLYYTFDLEVTFDILRFSLKDSSVLFRGGDFDLENGYVITSTIFEGPYSGKYKESYSYKVSLDVNRGDRILIPIFVDSDYVLALIETDEGHFSLEKSFYDQFTFDSEVFVLSFEYNKSEFQFSDKNFVVLNLYPAWITEIDIDRATSYKFYPDLGVIIFRNSVSGCVRYNNYSLKTGIILDEEVILQSDNKLKFNDPIVDTDFINRRGFYYSNSGFGLFRVINVVDNYTLQVEFLDSYNIPPAGRARVSMPELCTIEHGDFSYTHSYVVGFLDSTSLDISIYQDPSDIYVNQEGISFRNFNYLVSSILDVPVVEQSEKIEEVYVPESEDLGICSITDGIVASTVRSFSTADLGKWLYLEGRGYFQIIEVEDGKALIDSVEASDGDCKGILYNEYAKLVITENRTYRVPAYLPLKSSCIRGAFLEEGGLLVEVCSVYSWLQAESYYPAKPTEPIIHEDSEILIKSNIPIVEEGAYQLEKYNPNTIIIRYKPVISHAISILIDKLRFYDNINVVYQEEAVNG